MRILLVIYDNDSYMHCFPLGLGYIAAVLRKSGYDVVIYNQDMHHYPEEHLTEYLNKNKFDMVGVSVVGGYYQYRKLLMISDAINKSQNRPFYVIGGHGPSPEPEFFLRKTKADAVVIGEGEITIIELIEAILNHKSLSGVKGIAFWNGEKVVINERRPLIKDIDTISFPAYDLFPIDYYRLIRPSHVKNSDFVMHILSSRGCIFHCNFCYRMDEGFRLRSNENIIEEIRLLQKDYAISYISFADELLMSSEQRTISLCEDFIKSGLDIKWECNGRLNFAKPHVLKLMKRAGCVLINYGIEAIDDEVLKKMNKALAVKQIISGVEHTLACGISPRLNIIFGNIGDTKETLRKGVEFLLKYDDHAQLRTIRPVTPYPGSPLYYYAIRNGLFKDAEDFYENKHINSDLLTVNFTNMSDNEFYAVLLEANLKLIAAYFQKRQIALMQQTKKLYLERDATFRGFRQT